MRFGSLAVGLATFGLAAVLAAAPVGISDDFLSIDGKSALAKPGNGHGNGNGQGQGNGKGLGRNLGAEAASKSKGITKGGKASGAPNGRAVGHARNDAVSGVGHTPPGHAKKAGVKGVGASLGIKGSFNAIHASARAFEVASANSRVKAVRSYLDAAQTVSDIENAEDTDSTDQNLDAAIQAAAEAAAAASSQSVTKDMLNAVHSFANARELADIELSDETTQEIADRADGDSESDEDEVDE